MKKLSLIVICLGVFGFSGTVFAGAPWPGSIDCGFNDSMCAGGTLYEVDYTCGTNWLDDGTSVDVVLGQEAELRAEGGANGWADCRIDIDLESDSDVYRYEVKCEAPEDNEVCHGRNGSCKDVNDKVELEIKASTCA